MPILSDFIALAMAIGASFIAVVYIASQVWCYVAAMQKTGLHELVRTLKNAIQTLNESRNIWVKLTQLEVALGAAKAIDGMLPTEPAIHDQITHLKAVRTGLSNHALRSRIDKRLARMRATSDGAEQAQLGQALLRLLAHHEETHSADPQLIEHYQTTLQRYVEGIEQARTRKPASEDQGDPAYSGEILDAHHSLAEFSLDSDLPPGIHFFHQAEFRLAEVAGPG